MLQSIINDFYKYFIELVAERRNLTPEQTEAIADGRVLSARQAMALNMVDTIGGEKEALAWLNTEHKIDETNEIKDYKVKEEDNPFKQMLEGAISGTIFQEMDIVPLDGLVSIWQPSSL